MRKNSSADLRGSRNRSDITATESAPASITEAAFARVIPPIATSGLRVKRPRPPHAFEADHGIRLLFAGSRKHRPNGEIVRRSQIRLAQLLRIVRGNSQPALRPDNPAHRLRQTNPPARHARRRTPPPGTRSARSFMISLTMWRGRPRPRLPAQFPRLLQHHPRIPGLVAVLQQECIRPQLSSSA